MVYKVTKVIKNPSTEDFVGLCKKHFVKETLVSIAIILVGVIFGWLCYSVTSRWSFDEISLLMKVVQFAVALCAILSGVPAAFCFVMTFGNFVMRGSVLTRFTCKTMEDWLAFADKYTLIPASIRLAQRLKVEEKEIVEVVLDSSELRCRNTNTDEIGIISFGEDTSFWKKFKFAEDLSLDDDEMVLDLSGKELVAFVRSAPDDFES